MPYRTCDHLMEDGVYCSSPALRNQRYCYFHLNARARRVQAARARLRGDARRFQMPILDNMHAVQAGIQQVVDALADDRIQNRRAGLLLYALQQAAASLKTTPGWLGQRLQLKPDEPLSALEVRSLQEQYDLPFDTDLEAPPDVAAAEIDATVALPIDARPSQTEQPALARVPARPESPAARDVLRDPGEKHSEVAVHDLHRDPHATDQSPLKSPPFSHPAPLSTPANAA